MTCVGIPGRARPAIESGSTRKLMNTEAAQYTTSGWSWAPAAAVTIAEIIGTA
jgi:hypothetical protein